MKKRKQNSAFTLIELLVVISIIAILMAVMIPALRKAREAAKTVVCASNMRQISYAFNMYIDSQSDKQFPARWNANPPIQYPMQVVLYNDLGADYKAFRCPAALGVSEGIWNDYAQTPYCTSYGYNVGMETTNSDGDATGISLLRIKSPDKAILMADSMWGDSGNVQYRQANDLNLWGPYWKPEFKSSVIADWHGGYGNVLFADFSVSKHKYDQQLKNGEIYEGWWPQGKR